MSKKHNYPPNRKPTGPRPTAGRKPITSEPLERHSLMVSIADYRLLKSLGKNASEGLRVLIQLFKEQN